MAFTPITVTISDISGSPPTPAVGFVTFTLTEPINDGTTEILPAELRCVLDSNGEGSIVLAANDDGTTSPVGSQYAVVEAIEGAPTRYYRVTVPSAAPGGTISLAALAPS